MFRRLFWLVTGAGFGFGIAFWVMRTMRGAVDRYRPDRVTAGVADAVRALGGDLRAAAAEGRTAMKDAEAELRASIHRT